MPGENSYTNEMNPNLGTSFSAPIVSGIAALMRSVNNNLTPAQLIGAHASERQRISRRRRGSADLSRRHDRFRRRMRLSERRQLNAARAWSMR